MVWRYLALAVLVVLGTAGCNDTASKPVVSQPVIVMTGDEATADPAEVLMTGVVPTADQPVAAIRPNGTNSEADSFRPAFPDNVDYFSPPQLEPVETQPVPEVVVTGADADKTPAANEAIDLRVIGFVQVAGEPPRAMLHLNGKLELAGVGDAIGDLKVVAVNEPSVTVRVAAEELSFALRDLAVAAGDGVVDRNRTGGA